MKTIEFDTYGNPKPYEFINMTIDDIEYNFLTLFENSLTRKNIFIGYKKYCDDCILCLGKEIQQWINGSFTTQKENPNDIDIVTLLSFDCDEKICYNNDCIKGLFSPYISKNRYMVDGYLLLICNDKNSKMYKYCLKKYQYWLNWWGHDRNGNKKGIVLRDIQNEE
ncbi:hypothetical protein E4N95_12465 [Treponema denticola]|uniref:DUF6932 family protein n=1 Tax=Treponema denticola TaxID=158 RepID=UPI003D8B7BD0